MNRDESKSKILECREFTLNGVTGNEADEIYRKHHYRLAKPHIETVLKLAIAKGEVDEDLIRQAFNILEKVL